MSYKNSFYAHMKNTKYANWVECFELTAKGRLSVAETYRRNYDAYKKMMAKWRFNSKNVLILKNRQIKMQELRGLRDKVNGVGED